MMEHKEIEGLQNHSIKTTSVQYVWHHEIKYEHKSLKKNSKLQKIYGIGNRVLVDNNIK